ncbi:uncharacterized protein LOC112681281 [Sipha flava]|uniref:Uncharacterized protein LOC112681281 n=1 Tax=Sipha flava TaxID=143950 RepID=A0A8B8F9N6_9HEMI|nr:uncharacterized protein LOC112681281 [Sipha flava]
MVDMRTNISTIDKFYYLIGCLRENALDAISGIPISGDNYELAWSTLTARFDRPRLVAHSLINKLLSAPKASSESLVELNNFLVMFDEGVSVLESMRIPNLGDFFLFSVASRCLPAQSIKLFETQLGDGFPTMRELLTFIKSRINVLECVPRDLIQKSTKAVPQKRSPFASVGFSNFKQKPHSSFVTNMTASKPTDTCKVCKGSHNVSTCRKFGTWTAAARHKWVRDNKFCFRCLRGGHWAPDCKSIVPCDKCTRRHHPLLHPDDTVNSDTRDNPTAHGQQTQNDHDPQTSLVGHGDQNAHSVILGTALVHIRDCGGTLHTVRALVDSASQISAITAACSSRLGLPVTRWTAPVSGLSGTSVQNVQGLVKCHVQPKFAVEPVLKFDAWVFPTITSNMPGQLIAETIQKKYSNLALADPSFTVPNTVDLLLGADLFARVMDGKRISVGESYPAAFGSVFGWIIIGPVPHLIDQIRSSCPVSLTTSVEQLIDKFWRVEEPEVAPDDFTNDGRCELIFREKCTRDKSGRFTVPLLFRNPVTDDMFSGSRAVALKRFDSLEKRLSADDQLRQAYCKFMSEYITLGHMSIAKSSGTYFIPHHAVYKSSDVNAKLRVVFDASARTFTGPSLNQCLFSGPKLQRDIIDVLTLFRLPRYAFTADINKMYRQIRVTPEHRRYQHILWRDSPHVELKTYELNTVTYGVNCAPFLAIRVLHHIAEHDCTHFPDVRNALLFSTYVDDICVGADTVEAAITLQSNLISVLGQGGMQLKKWASNTDAILSNVSSDDQAVKSLSFDDSEGTGIKVLGLHWNHRDDVFHYVVQAVSLVTTKRGMLSLIARIFDPLGLLSPVIFYAKHLGIGTLAGGWSLCGG